MAKFEVQIATGNAAFQDGNYLNEVARILREVANEVQAGSGFVRIRDINGNRVGYASAETE